MSVIYRMPLNQDQPSEQKVLRSYLVEVNYDHRTPEEVRKTGDWIDDPLNLRVLLTWVNHPSCEGVDEFTKLREFFIGNIPEKFHNKKIKEVWDELASFLDKLGYRFAVIDEAVSFARVYSDRTIIDRDILVMGSSTVWKGGARCIAELYEDEDEGEGANGWTLNRIDIDDLIEPGMELLYVSKNFVP